MKSLVLTKAPDPLAGPDMYSSVSTFSISFNPWLVPVISVNSVTSVFLYHLNTFNLHNLFKLFLHKSLMCICGHNLLLFFHYVQFANLFTNLFP